MPRQRKRVIATCYGPIAFGPHYKAPWEDVWLRWKGKPGRRSYFSGPTLICRAELVADLERHRKRRKKRPKSYATDIAHDEAILQALEDSRYAVDDWDPPNVYTRAIGLDRAEAERMLVFLLERRYGVMNPKFEWKKTDFCITPTGFGDYSTIDETNIPSAVTR